MPDLALDLKFKTILDGLKQEFLAIRANRPTTKLVEDIKVDYLGQQLAIKQLGSISIVPPREIDINLWDKNAATAVAKAIENAKIGLTPNIDGSLIRLNLPTLTQERREELIKLVKAVAEQHKIKVRLLRDEANKNIDQLFKDKKISEDQKFKEKKQLQDSVVKLNQEIDKLLIAKIKEINE